MSVTKKSHAVLILVDNRIYYETVDQDTYLSLLGATQSVQTKDSWFGKWLEDKRVWFDKEAGRSLTLFSTTIVIRVKMT